MGEQLPQSTYAWRAIYSDGSSIEEREGVNYQMIDRSKLRSFEIIRKDSREAKLRVDFLPHQRLIWRRRVALRPGGGLEIVHIVGKQESVNGQNKQGIALLFERGGNVEFFDRFDAKHPFLREVQLLAFEV